MDKYRIKLTLFEGPLDLLLHLIQKSELDIYDIPIAVVAEQYLEYIDLMQELNLEVAGEFLLMAATLTQIKSRMLLPLPEGTELADGEDPRKQLVQKLLEYRRFKEAAESLSERESNWREVFVRGGKGAWEDSEELMPETLFNFGLMDLLEAFKRVIQTAPAGSFHEVTGDSVSITERTTWILELLDSVDSVTFEELFDEDRTRTRMVVTFLALLELARIRAIKILQIEEFGIIRIMKAVTDDGVFEA